MTAWNRALTGLDRRLRRLDQRLGIDHSGRSELIWAVPVLTFLGTFAMIMAMSWRGGLGLLGIPGAVIAGLVMAGMSVAYMTPVADEPGDDDPGDGGGRGSTRLPPPGPRTTAEEAPSPAPPPWWSGLDTPADEPAPRRRRPGSPTPR